MGAQVVRENQFYKCETWQSEVQGDTISVIHFPEDPDYVEFSLMVETSAGVEKEFGLLMGPRATFEIEKYAFIGFFG